MDDMEDTAHAVGRARTDSDTASTAAESESAPPTGSQPGGRVSSTWDRSRGNPLDIQADIGSPIDKGPPVAISMDKRTPWDGESPAIPMDKGTLCLITRDRESLVVSPMDKASPYFIQRDRESAAFPVDKGTPCVLPLDRASPSMAPVETGLQRDRGSPMSTLTNAECPVVVTSIAGPHVVVDRAHPGVSPPETVTDPEPSGSPTAGGDRRRKSHVKTYTLPPCKVCGAPGTGFHYGVNTCEACKGFFRRGLCQNGSLVCRTSGRCRLDIAGKRNMCAKCRWEKCLEVGMSVGGIKTGRYTAEKHTHNTMEVKRMEAKKAENRRQKEDVVRERLFEQLLVQLMDAFRETLGLDNMAREHLRSHVVSQGTQGPGQKPVSYKEFAQILSQTGVQVDDRLDMWKSWLGGINDAIKRAAKFAKAIPGFRDLILEDQAILLKKSLTENWLICRHMTFDLERKLFVDAPDRVFEVHKMFSDAHAHEVLKAVRMLQQLKLSVEERVLLSAFTVVTPDRAELRHPHQVAAVQDHILDAILWFSRKRRHEEDRRLFFARVVSVLTEMRNLDAQPEKENAESLFKVLLCGNVEVPPIVYEVTDVVPLRKPQETDDAKVVKLKDTLADDSS